MERETALTAANLLYKIEAYDNLKDEIICIKREFEEQCIVEFINDIIDRIIEEQEKLEECIKKL